MARQESDREDLLREATALVERIELQLPDFPEPVVAGFRRDGAASFFFGADPVFQFNVRNELRRGFLDGRLLKAERGQLIALRRHRAENAVQLLSDRLSSDEQAGVLRLASERLESLRLALENDTAQTLRCHPPDANVRERVLVWLTNLPQSVLIASRPNVS